MASRVIYKGAQVSTEAIEDAVYSWIGMGTELDADEMIDALKGKLNDALTALDDRLWWQPESDEICIDEDGSDRPTPEFDVTWWEASIGRALAELA